MWVDFKYENMGLLCFYCGRVGHAEISCWERTGDAMRGQILEDQYGEWLRADLRMVGSKFCNQKNREGKKDSVIVQDKINLRAGDRIEAANDIGPRELRDSYLGGDKLWERVEEDRIIIEGG